MELTQAHTLKITLDPTRETRGTLITTILHPGKTLQTTPIAIKIQPTKLTPSEITNALQKALAANTPTGAEKTLVEELTKQLKKSNLQPPGTSITEALQLCAATHNTLPVKLANPDQLKPRLRQILTAYDNGATGTQNYAICITKQTKQLLDLPKTCYGTYIDKQYINKILGPKTLTAFTGTCIASLIACEAATKLLAEPALAAAEAGAVCGLPALTATLTKNQIAEEIKKTGEMTTHLANKSVPLGISAGALLPSFLTVKRAAKYLQLYAEKPKGLLPATAQKARRTIISERWARKVVDSFWKQYTRDLPALRNMDEVIKLQFLANARVHDLAIIRMIAKKASEDELSNLIGLIREYLAEGHRTEFYKELLSKEEFRKALGLTNLGDQEIEKLASELGEAPTARKAEKVLQEAGMKSTEEFDEAVEIARGGKRIGKLPEIARQILKGAACSGVAYIAGTLSATKIFTPPPLPTLTIGLENHTLIFNNLEIGG